MDTERYFGNPYQDYQLGVTNFEFDKTKIKSHGLELLETTLSKGSRDGDGGLYVGAMGLTYAYLHVSKHLTPDEKRKYLPLAKNAFSTQTLYYQSNPSKKNDSCSFLLGKGGYFVLGAAWGKEIGDEKLQNECIENYVASANICKPLNFFKHGGDELFVGRAGYLNGALWLQQKLGYMPVARQDLLDIWNCIIESGQKYSKLQNSPCPLMYSYYGTEYLGAAHGLCAILQILISFPGFLRENPVAEKLVRESVEFYLGLQDDSGNFPCAMDEIGQNARQKDNMLVHWCHGAPGAIYLLAKAYIHYKDNKFLDAILKCGEVVWNHGLLRKGPGICHGIAGSGYVFLVIYNLLEQKDPKYLYRALKFAEFLQDLKFLREARRPDCPYSLYEGVAGTSCYIFDLLQPEDAEFPFFNFSVNYL